MRRAEARHARVPQPRPASGDQLDLFAGRDRADAATDPWWADVAMSAVRAMAATRREFQAYDLVTSYGIPEPEHPSRWGPLLARARREGLIVQVGAERSRRPATAGSLTHTWRGAS